MSCAPRLTFVTVIAIGFSGLAFSLTALGNAHPEAMRDISFRDLEFNAPPTQTLDTNMLPNDIQSLNGSLIRIRGFQFSDSFLQPQAKQFMMVRDNKAFFPWPISSNISVRMHRGTKAVFSVRPITVTGRLNVTRLQSAGKLDYIYTLRNTNVEYMELIDR